MSNLNYVVTLTAQKTSAIQEVMTELRQLQALVKEGAEFQLKLDGTAIKSLQKQIREAMRNTYMEMEGDMGGKKGRGRAPTASQQTVFDPALNETLTDLSVAVRELTRNLGTGEGVGGKRRVGVPGSRELFSAGSDLAPLLNLANSGQKPAINEVKTVLSRLEKAALKADVPESGKLRDTIADLRKTLERGRPKSGSSEAAEFELAIREGLNRVFERQTAVYEGIARRVAGVSSPGTSSGSGGPDWRAVGREIAAGVREALGTGNETSRAYGVAAESDRAFSYREKPVNDEEADMLRQQGQGSRFAQLDAKVKAVQRQVAQARVSGNTPEQSRAEKELESLLADLAGTAIDPTAGSSPSARQSLERTLLDRNSVSAKAAAQGGRWYSKQGSSSQNLVDIGAREGFVTLPGQDQSVLNNVMRQMGGSIAMFAKEKNPAEAQAQFVQNLKVEEERLAGFLRTNQTSAAAFVPPMVVSRLSDFMRTARAARVKEERGRPLDEYEAAAADAYGSMDWIRGMTPKQGYDLLRGPANYYANQTGRGMETANPGMTSDGRFRIILPNRTFAPGEERALYDDKQLMGLSPVNLPERFTGDKLNELSGAMDQWAASKGLQFYKQTANRERGVVNALAQDAELRARLLAEGGQEQTIARIDTRTALRQQELMQGGSWLADTDQHRLNRGRTVGGVNYLLTNVERDAFDNGGNNKFEGATRQYRSGGLGGPGSPGAPAVAGGAGGGGGIPVFVTNWPTGGGSVVDGQGSTPQMAEIMTSLRNTAEILRRIPKMSEQQMAGLTKLRQELGTRYKYREAAQQQDEEFMRRKAGVRSEIRKSREEESALRLLTRITEERAQAGRSGGGLRAPLDLVNGPLASGLDPSIYLKDQGLFNRDLRSGFNSYRRASSAESSARLAESNSSRPQDVLAALTRQRKATQAQERAQIEMAQLMLVRAGTNGDPTLQANRPQLEEFLKLAQEATLYRQTAGELKQVAGAQQIYGNKEQRLSGKIGMIEQYNATIAEAEAEQRSLKARYALYDQRDEANIAITGAKNRFGSVKGITEQLIPEITAAGDRFRAAEIIARGLKDRGLSDIDPMTIRQAIMPEKGTYDAQTGPGGAFSLPAALSYVSNFEQNAARQLAEANARRESIAAKISGLPVDSGRNSAELNAVIVQAKNQVTSLLGSEDPKKQGMALNNLKDQLEAARAANARLSEEATKKLQALAATLGVTFKDVDELMTKRLPEIDKRLKELGNTVVNTAAAETGGGGGGGGGGGRASFGESMARKILQLSQYVMAGSVVYSFANALRSAGRQVMQFEREMRVIQGVLETRSPVQRDQIGRSVIGAALEYGTDLTQSLRAARVYAQIGASPDEIGQLTRATLAAQQGAGFEGAQASEFLIAAKNISGDVVQPFDILDRVSRIEAKYAVTAQDLAQSIQRVGSLATQFQSQSLGGIDAFDTVIGATTAIIEQTRVSGNQASTALRFILSRLAAPDVASQLQTEFGIKLGGETAGQLRPMQDILSDISDAYVKLRDDGDTVRASRLLVTFAGARQANVAAALLGNFGRVKDIAGESAYAFGDSNSRAQMQLDTMGGRAQQLETAFLALTEAVAQATGATTLVKTGFETLAGWLGEWARNAEKPGGLAATGLFGVALAGGGYMAAAKATAEGVAQTSVTQLTAATGRLILGFGALAAVLAVVAGGFKLYEYYQDQTYGAGSRFRPQELDTKEETKQYEQQLGELAKRLGTGPSVLESTALVAGGNLRTDFDRRFGEGKYTEFLRGSFVNPAITETINKSLLSSFSSSISSFSQVGTETEQLNLAFNALRLTTSGLGIESEATRREFSRIADEYDVALDGVTSKLAGIFATRESGGGGAGYFSLDYRRSTPGEVLTRLQDAFRVGGMEMLTDVGSARTGGGTVRSQMEAMVAGGTDVQEALNTAITQAFNVSTIVAAQFWSRYGASRQETLRRSGSGNDLSAWVATRPFAGSIVGQINQDRVTNNQAPLTAQEESALYNQEKVYRSTIESLAQRYGGGATGSQVSTLRNRNTLEEAVANLEAPIQQAVRDYVQARADDKLPTSAAMIQAMTRGLQDPKTRPSTEADLATRQGAAARLRALYLQPYIQYIQRQSDITNMQGLNQYGIGYDYQSARAQASQELVLGLGRVRGSLLNNNLQEIVRLGAASRTLYQEDFEGFADDQKLVPGLGMSIASLPRRGAGGEESRLDPSAVTRTLATLRATKDMYEAYANNLQPLVNRVEGLPADVGNIGDKLVEALNDALGSDPDEAGEKIAVFFRTLVKSAKTEEEARRMATAQFAREQNVLLDRQDKQLSIGQDQFTGQLSIQRMAALSQLSAEYTAGGYSAYGRPDLAYQAQSTIFNSRRGELAQSRDLEYAILERSLANDPRNLSGRLLDQERRRGRLEIDKQYLSNVQQTDLEEERAVRSERGRRRDDIASQSRTLIDGVAAPLKSVLADYETLSKRGIPVVVEGLAQTFQNLFAERAVNMMVGADGFLTSGLHSVFTEASFQLNFHLNSAFVEGSLIAAQNIRTAFTGTGIPVMGPGAGISTTSSALGAYASEYLTDPGILPGGGGANVSSVLPGINVAGGTGSIAAKLRASWSKEKQAAQRRLQGGIALAQLGGSLGGGFLGSRVNMGEQTYAQEGGSIGTAIGSGVATLAGMTGIGLVVAPLIGGLLGGLLGGSAKKKSPDMDPQLMALERIERNTREQIDAIEVQTQLLTPDSRFLNVPAGFVVPNFRPGLAGNVGDVNIYVYGAPGQSESLIAQQVAKALQNELGTRGASFDVRNL